MLAEITAYNPNTDSKQVSHSIETFFSSELELKTQEGDVVTLSFQNAEYFGETQTQGTGDSDSTVSAISVEAAAAAQYALEIQGDLNDEELAAIQELSSKVAPIVEQFFNNAELDEEAIATDLAKSLGVVNELTLVLEKTVTRTATVQSASYPETASDLDVLEGSEVDGGPDLSQVRDLQSLASAVADAQFRNQAAQSAATESILRSLGDLLAFIRKQFGAVLEPLSTVKEEFPDTPDTTSVPPESVAV
ncbi:MAG: hypothetical protein G3M78_06655 [Candidatus Nitrohelix vancouverensis]|uniref:DUF5610 domain-containing protein n=1 Tax=Candidatus Nitrohelix vancouverensis TaxID=2705534 RepID=A0A7T0C240_9BACT|nr:MAG: hypothetical protein G3M78_06655 [Candidatus Nitrohelix vancouverensis]